MPGLFPSREQFEAEPLKFASSHLLKPGVYKLKLSKTRFAIAEVK